MNRWIAFWWVFIVFAVFFAYQNGIQIESDRNKRATYHDYVAVSGVVVVAAAAAAAVVVLFFCC